jgi:hypothetical protein
MICQESSNKLKAFSLGESAKLDFKQLRNFADVTFTKNKKCHQIIWVPGDSSKLAASYIDDLDFYEKSYIL